MTPEPAASYRTALQRKETARVYYKEQTTEIKRMLTALIQKAEC